MTAIAVAYGRAPAERRLDGRDDGERDTAAGRREAAVEALGERRPARRADEVAAADEAERRPDSEQSASPERERGLRRDAGEHVSQGHDGETGGADPSRSEPVAQPPRRQLHEHVDEEQDSGEEPDHAERGAVGVGERLGDGAGVGDVPARREADGAAAGDGSTAHAGRGREMIDVVGPRTGTAGL